jgi:hypothetical protein
VHGAGKAAMMTLLMFGIPVLIVYVMAKPLEPRDRE